MELHNHTMLAEKIQQDLVESLKAKDSSRVETLRLLRAEIQNAQIDSKEELTDAQIEKVLSKYAKKLADSREMFEKGGRTDLVDHVRAQESIVAAYLPAEMSDAEISAAIDTLIAENEDLFTTNRNAFVGIAMKSLSARASGARIMKEIQSR